MSEEAARLVQILQGAIETGVGIAEARAALVIHISRIERERDEAQEWDRRSKAALLDAGRRIAALEAENARLRTLRDDVCVALSGPGGLRFEDMPERAKLLRQNSERYEWLCAEHERIDPLCRVIAKNNSDRNGNLWVDVFDGMELNRVIDAARKP